MQLKVLYRTEIMHEKKEKRKNLTHLKHFKIKKQNKKKTD